MRISVTISSKDSSLTLWGGYAVAFILIAGGGTCYMVATVLAYIARFMP